MVIGWIAVITTLTLVPVGVWYALTVTRDPSVSWIDELLFRLPGVTLGPVGLLIANRQRENRIAWILIALGLVVAASAVASDASKIATDALAAALLGMVGDIGWLALVTLFCALVLLYPDGHLPSRRWRPLGLAVPGWLALFVVSVALAPTSLHHGLPVPNPLGGAPGALGGLAQLSLSVAIVLLIPLLLAVVTAAVARWRHATGVVRRQLELFVYMASLFVLGLGLSATGLPGPWETLSALAVLGLPVAIAIAVLRYRLYDIDVVIERTLVYGALSAALALTYWLLVLFLQSALRPITAGNELSVAVSTLATLALVQPLRSWIQRSVDRRFYRARYDAAHTLDSFSVRLRDEVDLGAVHNELLDAVGQTVQPATASLWLRERGR
jgi:uncharacterized membrane protein